MSKATPPAPDYTGAAQAQANSSREVTEQQTWANRPTINTPFGQQTWEVKPQWDPSTGQYINSWTQNTNLTPESQAALDSQMRIQQGKSSLAESMLGRAQGEFGQPMDWNQFQQMAQAPQTSQYGAAPNVPNYTPQNIQQSVNQTPVQTDVQNEQVQRSVNPEDVQRNVGTQDLQRQLSSDGLQNIDPSQRYYGQAGDAIYNQWAGRQEPRMEQESERMRTQLYNQGLKEGDAAYDQQMQRLRQDQNDARQQAQYQATIGAGQEASRMFGMDSSARGQMFGERQQQGAFANQAANDAFQQSLAAGQFGNQAAQQAFGQNLAGGQFANQAAQQAFEQNMGRGQFANQAAGQQFQQGLAGGQFANQAAAQALQQQLGIGSQQFNQQMANSQLGDTRANNQFNQQLTQANYQNQLRQQQIAEQMQQRGFSLNEINAILNGQQVSMPNMPTFNTANRSESTQYNQAAQNQGQFSLDAFSAQQAGMNSAMQGLGGMAMMFSDRRLKKDIEFTEEYGGYRWYTYHYIWEPENAPFNLGVMADELGDDHPAVYTDASGYKMVDYGRL